MLFEDMKRLNGKKTILAEAVSMRALFIAACLLAQPAISADSAVYKPLGSSNAASDSNGTSASSLAGVRTGQFSSDTLGGRNKESLQLSAVEITSPRNNEIISTNNKTMIVSVSLAPLNYLPEGYTTEIRMNGTVVSNSSRVQSSVPVPMIGPHIFKARILNSNGVTITESSPVSIRVK